jgi:transposase-like protein
VVLERMLAGLATRRHTRASEPVGVQVAEAAKSTSKSAISRRFVKETETALAELMARDLSGEDVKVLMCYGEHMADRCVVVALAITADGTKAPVGLWEGSTENKTVVRSLLADLVDRGLSFDDGLLVVIDGAKALAAAVREVFGGKALVQRCTWHKRRNVADHLPDKEKEWVDAKLVKAFGHPDPEQGLRHARHLAGLLENSYPGAAASLREGLEEMFTVARLGIDGRLAKTLTTSNPIESMISIARTTNRNVTRWKDGAWCCAGPRPACSTPSDPSVASRATSRCRNWSRHCIDTHTPRPPGTPKLSVRPPRVHRGSSPKFHATRDMLISGVGMG